MTEFEMVCCIVNHDQGTKALKIAKNNGVRGGTICLGKGTVKNRLLEILDINDARKEILFMAAPKETARQAMSVLTKEMTLHKPYHGILFSFPLKNYIGTKHFEYINNDCGKVVEKAVYNAIFTVVSKGLAENVVESAIKGGASGATIINARGSGINDTSVLFAMQVEPEKELVLVLAKDEETHNITAAIREGMHIDEPGNGIIFIVGVNEAFGVRE